MNDTDPQSPLARGERTDPGVGPAPSHSVASAADPARADVSSQPSVQAVDQLLDGITGPRPPPSSRGNLVRPASVRAYVPARQPPASQPPPRAEPRVISPPPRPVTPVGAVGTEPPSAPLSLQPSSIPPSSRPSSRFSKRPSVDPGSVRPMVRRAEEKTVYVGRRAFFRNATAVVLSGALVAAVLFAAMRWSFAPADRSAGSPGTASLGSQSAAAALVTFSAGPAQESPSILASSRAALSASASGKVEVPTVSPSSLPLSAPRKTAPRAKPARSDSDSDPR